MEDLLELDELVSTVQTEVIPPRSNKTIKSCTPLVLLGVRVNMISEPLHQDDKALPPGLHIRPSYSMYRCGSQRTDVQLYNTKDHPIILQKGTTVARMVTANEVPDMVVAGGMVGTL